MNEVLKKLNRVNGVRGSLLVSRDGMVLVSEVTEGIDESGMSALSSTIFVNLENALKRLSFGNPAKIAITGERGRIVLYSLSGELILAVNTRKEVNMGLLNVELKEAARELQEKLKR